MSTTIGGVRIADMPDLGAVTDDSSVVGEHAGSGRFAATALLDYVVAGLPPAPASIGRNLLHNPLFNVAQRGAGPFTATGAYTLDRWLMFVTGSTVNVSLQTLSDANRAQIGDEAAQYAIGSVCTGTAGAGDLVIAAEQRIENVRRSAGKTVTVSFWAAAATGTPRLGLELYQHFGLGGSPSADVTGIGSQAVTLSGAFARYSVAIAVPSASGKTLGTNGGDFLGLRFWQSSGATNNAEAGGIGVQSYTLFLWGVQLEIGTQATPLEKPDPRYDLSNCQRFYQTMGGVQCTGSAGGVGVVPLSCITFSTMRGTPSAVASGVSFVNGSTLGISPVSLNAAQVFMTSAAAGAVSAAFNVALSADL